MPRATMRWRDRSWAAGAAAVTLAAAAATALYTVVTVYRLHVPLPYWDEWYTILHFRHYAAGGYALSDLASQHNEHRLLFPRLFFFADERFSALSGLLDLTVIFALQSANAAILIALMLRRVGPRAHRALLVGFVVLMLFTLRQEQNFSNGFQLQFVGVFTAAALGAVAYVTALERMAAGRGGAAPFFALAALACAVSAYTMANGVLAGGVLAGAALLRGTPWRVPAVTLTLSALLATLFFHGYVPGRDSLPLSHALAHPLPYLRYLTAYLGNPVSEEIRASQVLGTLGLGLAAAAAWRVATGRTRDPAGLTLLTIAGFVLASAAATAYGRIALGTDQALGSRYATPSLLFWSALVVFWFPVAVPGGRAASPGAALGAAPPLGLGAASALGLGALMAVLGFAAVRFEATARPALAERADALRHVADSLISGLYDADAAGTYENTSPGEVAPEVPFLRENHLAAFADPDASALGRPLASLGAVAAPGACLGTVAAQADPALGPGGVRLSGTARDAASGRAPTRIVVAGPSGRVTGFGSASLPGQPTRLWSGYASGAGGDVLHAYARLADGTLCDLGGTAVSGET